MKKWYVNLIAVITGLALVLTLAFTAMQIVIFDIDRYEKSYEAASTHEYIGISKEDLTYVTQSVLDYMELKAESMDVVVTIKGAEKHAFRDRELIHMVDVRNLFAGGFRLRRIAIGTAAVGLVLLILLTRKKWLKALCGGFLAGLALFLLFALVVGIAVAIDFYDVFILFHKIFFTNDFWLLDAQDMLIMMFPEEFFNAITVALLEWMTALVLVPGIAALLGKILSRKKGKKA